MLGDPPPVLPIHEQIEQYIEKGPDMDTFIKVALRMLNDLVKQQGEEIARLREELDRQTERSYLASKGLPVRNDGD